MYKINVAVSYNNIRSKVQPSPNVWAQAVASFLAMTKPVENSGYN